MVKVQCIKCNREGSLTKKQTKSKGITYVYWYVEHHIGDKIKWCYLGKYEKLSDDYKRLIHKDTQIDTQNPSITTQTESIETHNQRSSEITSFQKSGSLLLLSPKSLYKDSSQPHLSIPSMKCLSPFSNHHTFGQCFYRLFRGVRSISPRLPYCKFCISLRFLLSSFKGQSGLKHSLHGLRPLICTRTSGHPQELQVFPMGLTVPRWGRGNDVLQMPLK